MRERVKEMFRRGNLTLMLNVTWDKGGGAGFRVNKAVLGELLAILPDTGERYLSTDLWT